MIKLSNCDGRFVVRLLELRRAAILEMTQQLPEQSGKERAAELRHLDAELTQITDPESLRPFSLCVACEMRVTILRFLEVTRTIYSPFRWKARAPTRAQRGDALHRGRKRSRRGRRTIDAVLAKLIV